MKKYTVMGVVHSFGKSQDEKTGKEFSWDNIVLHCMMEDDRTLNGKEILAGSESAIIKCKNNFKEVVSCNGALKHFGELLGSQIRVYYDEYGKVDCIEVVNV